MDDAPLTVTVVFSPAPRALRSCTLSLRAGSTVAEALAATGWNLFEGLSGPDALQVGVWGRRATPEQRLREGDRVEVYRPLRVDPKVARRERFVRQGAGTPGLFARRRPGAKPGY